MSFDTVPIALGRKLDEADLGHLIVWENDNLPAGQDKPYLIFEYVPTSRTDRSLVGGSAREAGFVQITVMSKKGKFANEGRAIAEAVADVFDRSKPGNAQIIEGGVKIIIGNAAVLQPYPDGPTWRTPVQINVSATKT